MTASPANGSGATEGRKGAGPWQMRRLIAFGVVAAALGALLWLGQFRYAWKPLLEEDRFSGLSYAQVQELLGQPASEAPAGQKGHEIEPAGEFDRVVTYEPLWGRLLLYFNGSTCVGSVFYTDAIRF